MGPKKDAGKGKDKGKGGKVDPKKAAASSNKKGAKPKKKSWTKVKVKDKLNNATVIDAKAYDKIQKDSQKGLVITVSSLMEKYKICGAVARRALRDMA